MSSVIFLLLTLAIVLGILLGVASIRRSAISTPIFNIYRKVLPQMSDTERDALEAGTVWWEGELFGGRPNWEKLLSYPRPQLTKEEQSFMDTQVEHACRMVDD